MAGLEERMAKVEGIVEQISVRLNHLENRMMTFNYKIRRELREDAAEQRLKTF